MSHQLETVIPGPPAQFAALYPVMMPSTLKPCSVVLKDVFGGDSSLKKRMLLQSLSSQNYKVSITHINYMETSEGNQEHKSDGNLEKESELNVALNSRNKLGKGCSNLRNFRKFECNVSTRKDLHLDNTSDNNDLCDSDSCELFDDDFTGFLVDSSTDHKSSTNFNNECPSSNILVENNELLYECEICGISFSGCVVLVKHILLKHSHCSINNDAHSEQNRTLRISIENYDNQETVLSIPLFNETRAGNIRCSNKKPVTKAIDAISVFHQNCRNDRISVSRSVSKITPDAANQNATSADGRLLKPLDVLDEPSPSHSTSFGGDQSSGAEDPVPEQAAGACDPSSAVGRSHSPVWDNFSIETEPLEKLYSKTLVVAGRKIPLFVKMCMTNQYKSKECSGTYYKKSNKKSVNQKKDSQSSSLSASSNYMEMVNNLTEEKINEIVANCSEKFREMKRTQLLIQNGIKKYRCLICTSIFVKRKELQKHMSTHPNVCFFRCHFCGEHYRDGYTLRRHLSCHANIRPFKCKECGFAFRQNGSLKSHMSVHSKQRNFSCSICNKTFRTKYALKVHQLSHSDARDYHCKICKTAFKDKYYIKTHMRQHTKEKRHKCDQCDATFMQRYSLRLHQQKQHQGVKPFVCAICFTEFHTPGGLTNHNITQHSDVPS